MWRFFKDVYFAVSPNKVEKLRIFMADIAYHCAFSSGVFA